MMLPSPVDYQIYRGGPLVLPPGKAYAYYLAGNGVWKLAANRHFEVMIPVARCEVAGLPDVHSYLRLLCGKVPAQLLQVVLEDAQRRARERLKEAMYHFEIRDGMVRVLCPQQQAGALELTYLGGGSAEIFLDLHSHHEMTAHFSDDDDRDEQGLRLYGVLGCIFAQPEIRLRVGVYGDFYPLPPRWLFSDLPAGLCEARGDSDEWTP